MSPFQPSLDLFLMSFFYRIAKFETIKEEWGILEITHEFCIAIKIFKFQNFTVKFEIIVRKFSYILNQEVLKWLILRRNRTFIF